VKRLVTVASAAAVALVLTAALAASAGAETVLCKTAAEPCGESDVYGVGTTLTAKPKAGTKTKFSTYVGDTECESSALSGQLAEASTPIFTVTPPSFTNCSGGAVVTSKLQQWHGVIANSAGVEDDKYVLYEMRVEIYFSEAGIHCRYGQVSTNRPTGQIKNNSEVVFNAAPLLFIDGSFFCGSGEAAWMSGTYVFSSPSPLYVSWF
jgi:hypothetical protein